MQAFFRITLPLVFLSGALAALASYAYGVHSARSAVSAQERTHATDSDASTNVRDDNVLEAPPSWRHWPSLTDF
jgi:hypothetical protein